MHSILNQPYKIVRTFFFLQYPHFIYIKIPFPHKNSGTIGVEGKYKITGTRPETDNEEVQNICLPKLRSQAKVDQVPASAFIEQVGFGWFFKLSF